MSNCPREYIKGAGDKELLYQICNKLPAQQKKKEKKATKGEKNKT